MLFRSMPLDASPPIAPTVTSLAWAPVALGSCPVMAAPRKRKNIGPEWSPMVSFRSSSVPEDFSVGLGRQSASGFFSVSVLVDLVGPSMDGMGVDIHLYWC